MIAFKKDQATHKQSKPCFIDLYIQYTINGYTVDI